MISAADSIDRVRPFAEALVENETRRRGSKMSAYAAVGDVAGVSESWVRRLLGRRRVIVELHHALNLAEAYRRLCASIEAERDLELRRLDALREAADAIAEGDLGVVVGAARADRGSEAAR